MECFRSASENLHRHCRQGIEQEQATFREIAAAQTKAWSEAADTIQDAATKFAAERRADIDATVKQMKADASEAEARLQKLKKARARRESWTALSAALAESRKDFDRANQADHDLSRTFRAGTRALTLESLVSRYGRSRLAPRSRFRP